MPYVPKPIDRFQVTIDSLDIVRGYSPENGNGL